MPTVQQGGFVTFHNVVHVRFQTTWITAIPPRVVSGPTFPSGTGSNRSYIRISFSFKQQAVESRYGWVGYLHSIPRDNSISSWSRQHGNSLILDKCHTTRLIVPSTTHKTPLTVDFQAPKNVLGPVHISTLSKPSSRGNYHGIRPYSGGRRSSDRCIHPPLPADPAPPCPLDPLVMSTSPRRFRGREPGMRTPPDAILAPDVDAITWACEIASGSSCPYFVRTSCRISRNLGFSRKESVVGGSFEVIPIDRSGLGGSDGRSDRM